MNVQVVCPYKDPNWNRSISKLKGATIFHTANWAQVLVDSYGYNPNYFVTFKGQQLTSCIPIMQIDSILNGRRAVCLPFSDECQPLGDADSLHSIWTTIIRHAEKKKWKNVELRGENVICESSPSSSVFKIHTIKLNATKSQLENCLRDTTRRNIYKAKKNRVLIKKSKSINALKSFYTLHCITRKRHGAPPQPFSFFEKIFKYIIAKDKGFILTAFHSGSLIAAAIYFTFNGMVLYKFGASNMEYQALRANNLIMWNAIEQSIDLGFNLFHFGRTDPSNEGLLQFKRGWGAEENNLHYYKYQRKKKCFVNEKVGTKFNYSFLKKTPISMLKIIGKILYKHAG